MRAIVRGRTVIIIAHRLAAVRPCTRIVGMHKGEIVEVGSHEELLRARTGSTPVCGRCSPIRRGRAHERERRAAAAAGQARVARPAVDHGTRPGIPACRSGDSGDAAAPLPVALMLTICAFFAGGADLVVFRPARRACGGAGQDRDRGRAKVIEPLDPGKIAAIHVENGRRVKAGDLLLELDPAEADADARRAARRAVCEPRRDRAPALCDRSPRRAEALDAPTAARGSQDARRSCSARSTSAAADAECKIAWDDASPETVPLARGGGARADLAQLADALKPRQADGEKLATQRAPQYEHRLPEHVDRDLEPARHHAPAGDRPQRRHEDQSL